MRGAYGAHPDGPRGYYADAGAEYRNPHEPGVRLAIARWAPTLPAGRILDLAAGSGEVTLALVEAGIALDRIDAADPFTGAAYAARVGRAPHDWSFESLPDRLEAGTPPPGPYGAVICSFALHLCPASRLPSLALALARRAAELWVLTPHKRPVIEPRWGWILVDEHYDPIERVRARRYAAIGGQEAVRSAVDRV